MVVDSSAIVAILRDEPEAATFVDLIAAADDPIISAATLAEASIVMQSREGDGGVTDVDELLANAGVRCVAVDDMQAYLALEGFHRYGKGRSPAALNFGDCFAYALAKRFDRPLLFKGNDFRQTNVEAAL
ncbi:MAG: type II toxin-antitoxin system VapC family toxin [Solirubrobacteraceae bacterium]